MNNYVDTNVMHTDYSDSVKISREKCLDVDIHNIKNQELGQFLKEIEEISFNDAYDVDIKRENANIDGNTAMGTMLQYGSAVAKFLCKNTFLSKEHQQAHTNGIIHIHDMDFYNMGTLTCCQIDIGKLLKNGFSTGHGYLREPQDIMSYSALSAIAIQSNQNDQHGGQSIPFFDFGLAPGVAKTFRKTYIENLCKGIRLLVSKDLFDRQISIGIVKEIIDRIESISETSLNIAITQDANYFQLEKEVLQKEFLFETDVIEKLQMITYKDSYAETDRKTFQAMEGFIHNLNTMHSRAGAQVPFSSINFGTDTSEEGRMVTKNLLLAQERGLGNGETPIFPILIFKVKEGVSYNENDKNYDLFKLACRVSSKRLFPNFSFLDAPFNRKYYIPNQPETEVAYMGCRTRVLENINGPSIVTGRGNLSFTTINLPRLGIKHGVVRHKKVDLEAFFKELHMVCNMVINQLLERLYHQGKKKTKNFPFLMGQGVWLNSEKNSYDESLSEIIKEGTLSIGFIGLAECLKALIGKHHGESKEAQKLGLKIISYMREKTNITTEKYKLNFSLLATPAEGIAGRFTALDRKKFGTLSDITDREYYTNSFHVPVHYSIKVYDKINIEAPYHELTNAGHISYVELDGDLSKNQDAFMRIIMTMKELGIGYGSINHPVDRDPVCGYTGIINEECPKCGRNESDNKGSFQRIRRITGYLVGTLDRFNNAKKSEVDNRIIHLQHDIKSNEN